MKIFHIGIPTNQIASLESLGIMALTDSVQSPDDVRDWICDGGCEAVVLNLEHPTATKIPVQDMRSAHVTAPIVGLLSARDQSEWSEQRSVFLEGGGDDLVMRPLHPRELAASLRAVTRRQIGMTSDIKEVHYKNVHIVVNLARQTVSVNGERLLMVGKMLQLFLTLFTDVRHIHSHEKLMSTIYEHPDDEASLQMLKTSFSIIRKKLRQIDPEAGELIESERGIGYRISGDATE